MKIENTFWEKNVKKCKNRNETIMLSIAKWKNQVVTINFFQKSSQIWFIFGHFLRFQKCFQKRIFIYSIIVKCKYYCD